MRSTLILAALGLAACVMLTLGGCATRPDPAMVVEAADVPRLSLQPDVVVLDARKPEDFQAKRLDVARHVSPGEWNKAGKDPATSLDNPAAWQPTIDALGIGRDTRVLVYDAGNMTGAATIWFTLSRLGVTNVAIVNGSWGELQKALPAERTASGPAIAGAWAPTPSGARIQLTSGSGVQLATKDMVKQHLAGGNVKILDGRSRDEFVGKERMDNARVGHLKGAVNIPHRELTADGRLLPRDQLRSTFEAAGLSPNDRITTHCQGGGRSALVAFALMHAGYQSVENYYGSFGEWQADASCPIEEPDGAM